MDIAVQDGLWLVEGDAEDGAGGVRADPRQRPQGRPLCGQLSAMFFDDLTGCSMQVAGTGVVTKPLPEFEDVLQVSRRQCLDGGKAFHPAFEVASCRLRAGLLQHHLADPDRIGGALASWGCTPGQQPALVGVPVHQLLCQPRKVEDSHQPQALSDMLLGSDER